ncbi:LmeA family phospholipid-binding protein [Mycetocola zhadangensis]|uniref:DUF2993 domain-containing protein n=1 Tax=Mycetocola zhadangensis TaxID=1164595 RepID=A0A3L7IT42_9MICO|nr:DUF2993 domain-containing protein [Mycetocola zhadangensis]RLQ81426.1 DUF2993 domain-containing protein [Mycetocola zhadangensis]GGF01802.1 hypothetical protein GCM10011313_26130 [Mycetocola zhadangensis]
MLSETDGWETLSRQAAIGDSSEPPRKRKRVRGWIIAVVILLVGAALVIGGLFLAENVTKGIATDAIAVAVEASLPATVDADVDVDIAGDWVLFQIFTGKLEQVTLSSDDAMVDGSPAVFELIATQVPLDLKQPVGNIDATVSLGPGSINELLTLPGNDPEVALGDDIVSYADSASVLGFTIGYSVNATLTPAGTDVLAAPVAANVTSDVGSLDVSGVIERILGAEPVPICVADRLPLGVTISGIDVTPEAATLSLAASDFTLNGESLRNRGTCPEVG